MERFATRTTVFAPRVASALLLVAAVLASCHRAPDAPAPTPTRVQAQRPVVTSVPAMPLRDAVGDRRACATDARGRVACWGAGAASDAGTGRATVPGLEGVIALVLGAHHACALTRDATVHCWGANARGQLGDGTTRDAVHPTTVAGLTDVVEIAAGADHTCARTRDSAVHCWGDNDAGQLGDATTATRDVPVQVEPLSGATALALGDAHSCALMNDGTARCWGDNRVGQLGDGTHAQRTEPVAVRRLAEVTHLVAAARQTCALNADGTLRCWGAGVGGVVQTLAAPVEGLDDVALVALGPASLCARLTDQSVRCEGDLGFDPGRTSLGRCTRVTAGDDARGGDTVRWRCDTSVPVVPARGAQSLTLGRAGLCATFEGRRLVCWGGDIATDAAAPTAARAAGVISAARGP